MARDLDGTNYISCGQGANVNFATSTMSIHAWVNVDSSSPTKTIVGKAANSFGDLYYLMRVDTLSPAFWFGTGSGADYVGCGAGVAVTAGVWSSLLGVKEATVMRMYADGVVGADVANSRSHSTGGLNTYLGVSNVAADGDQKQAEVAIWDVALTAGEAVALAKGFSPLLIRPQSLKAYFPLYGNVTPEVCAKSGIATAHNATPAKVAHPRIIMPRPAIYLP